MRIILDLCKRLRSQQSPLPILMLTAKDRMEDKIIGLDAGADDYLVKPFGMAELLARLSQWVLIHIHERLTLFL